MSNLVLKAYYSDNTLKKSSHYHDCHQIILIMEGSVKFQYGDGERTAQSGDLVIFSRYENHSVEVLSDEYKRYVLHISPKMHGVENRVYSLLLNRPQGFSNVIATERHLGRFVGLFKSIIEETEGRDDLSDDMQRLLVNQLLITVYRHLEGVNGAEDQNANAIYAIQRQFETDYGSSFSLDALSAQHNMSVSSLSHQFKRLTGFSVMEYLLSCRIASAKNYLVKTDLSIGEIVDRCGFSDCSNFCRTFKKLNGMSPSAFRKKYK